MRITSSCEHGGSLLRRTCGRAAVAECVYCGKPFCETHGELGPDFTNVCDRKTCVAKLHDVEAHLEWKQRVYNANRISICAHDGCEDRMHHVCSRCRLLFCESHVRELTVVIRSERPPRRELTVICFHCRDRRKLWG
jgi:hypothetical protein